jgi:hypothetical protein
LNTRIDLVRREKLKVVIYKPIPNQVYHVFPPISIRDGHLQPCHVYALASLLSSPHYPSPSPHRSLAPSSHTPTNPFPILTIVPQLSTTGQITQITILHHTYIKLTTHKPVKPAREKIHSVPKSMNGTSRIAALRKRRRTTLRDVLRAALRPGSWARRAMPRGSRQRRCPCGRLRLGEARITALQGPSQDQPPPPRR